MCTFRNLIPLDDDDGGKCVVVHNVSAVAAMFTVCRPVDSCSCGGNTDDARVADVRSI
jgi:hypothetical protein